MTLHRLGLFGVLGRSLKTDGLESVNEERCAKVDHFEPTPALAGDRAPDIEPRLLAGYRPCPSSGPSWALKIDTTTAKKTAAQSPVESFN